VASIFYTNNFGVRTGKLLTPEINFPFDSSLTRDVLLRVFITFIFRLVSFRLVKEFHCSLSWCFYGFTQKVAISSRYNT
jgi:hypothetical protein